MSLLWVQASHRYRPGYCTKCDGDCQQPQETPTLFHGTSADLEPGDRLLPGHQSGRIVEDFGDDTHDSVWMTPDLEVAQHYAETAAGVHGGDPRVYEVHHPDPEPNGDDYLAPHATVVRRVR